MASNSLQSIKKQGSEGNKSSEGAENPLEKFIRPLQLLRHGSSQEKSVSERDRLGTPTSQATLKRNLSIFGLGPQIQSSLLQNIGLAPMNVRLQTPQSSELNNLLQPGSVIGRSPSLLNYQQRSISGLC